MGDLGRKEEVKYSQNEKIWERRARVRQIYPKLGGLVEERKTNTAKFGRFRKRQGKEVKYT